jgi:multidrug efflux pump subunit AcrA (membrane-fusion protein)
MRFPRWGRWLVGLIVLLGVVVGCAWYWGFLANPWQPTPPAEVNIDGQNPAAPQIQTSPVQRADQFLLDVKVGGKLEFRTLYEIKAPFDEAITTVQVEVGAIVKTGTVLATLDREKLTTQLDTTWLDLTQARQELSELIQGATLESLVAQAELSTAQEELDKLEKGPSSADAKGAQLAVAEAQIAYDELLKRNDPNAQKVRQARYALKQAEDTLQRAQSAYDAVSWKGDIGASSEAAALQSATTSFEEARNAYADTIKPPTELELQKAQLEIAKAQNGYNKLLGKATPAQLEQARVKVAKAQEKVDELQQGPAPLKVQEAEAKVLEALSAFESTRTKLLTTSNLQAPVDGLVIKMAVKPGQVVKAGDTVAIVAETNHFKLTLPVSEVRILQINEGMPVNIVFDVLPDQTITGTVASIAPLDTQASSDNSGAATQPNGGGQLTTYPVIIQVADSPLNDKLRAGMSAQVTFVGTNGLAPNSWLVPTNALDSTTAGQATVQVLRGEAPQPLQVTVTEQTLGEWVVVVSPDLHEGDQVVGSTASFLNAPGSGPQFGP